MGSKEIGFKVSCFKTNQWEDNFFICSGHRFGYRAGQLRDTSGGSGYIEVRIQHNVNSKINRVVGKAQDKF